MEKSDIYIIIKKMFIDNYNVKLEYCWYKTNIKDDIGIDSLGLSELSLYIEEIFDVYATEEDLYDCENVEDVVDLIFNLMEIKKHA